MAQDLNEVQVAFVNEEVRVDIEKLVRIRYELSAMSLEFANQQSPITNNTETLNDATGGTSPRTDAPTLTGQNVNQISAFANALLAQIDDTALDALVKLSVRTVSSIVRG